MFFVKHLTMFVVEHFKKECIIYTLFLFVNTFLKKIHKNYCLLKNVILK
mgnify:CR=1 FL=1